MSCLLAKLPFLALTRTWGY